MFLYKDFFHLPCFPFPSWSSDPHWSFVLLWSLLCTTWTMSQDFIFSSFFYCGIVNLRLIPNSLDQCVDLLLSLQSWRENGVPLNMYFSSVFLLSVLFFFSSFLSLFPLLSSLNTVHNLPGHWECFRLSWFGIGMTHRPSPHCRMFTHMAHPLALVATNSEPATDWMVDLALWLIEFRGRLYHTIAGPF